MHQDVFVAGVGMIPFTKPGANEPYPQMAAQATRQALADAGLGYEQVQQAYVGYVYGDSTAGQAALYEELLADARAAGITEVTALVATDNKAAVSLLQRVLGRLDARFEGTELSVRAALAEAMAGTAASPRAGAAPARGSA